MKLDNKDSSFHFKQQGQHPGVVIIAGFITFMFVAFSPQFSFHMLCHPLSKQNIYTFSVNLIVREPLPHHILLLSAREHFN